MADERSGQALARLTSEAHRLHEVGADPEIIGQVLLELKAAAEHGQWLPALAQIRPDDKTDQARWKWAKACMERARREAAIIAEREAAGKAEPFTVYAEAMYIDKQPKHLRPGLVAQWAEHRGWSERTAEAKIRRAREQGLEGLERKRRADAGTLRGVSAEAAAAFTRRRLDKEIRRESLELSIAAVRAQFPDQKISSYSLRRAAARIPIPATMDDARWRARNLPTGQWEVPYPNHTHALDFTIADVFVYAALPKPHIYRPWLTAIVDECSHSCMFALYTEETPNREILQAVLLNAILPKPDDVQWPQCGAPEHLHADNGKVQTSEWLKQVCTTLGTDLGLMRDVRHSAVQEPWQNGHIESFFGIVHASFEVGIPGYCGRDPKHRPENAPDPRKPKTWEGLHSLDGLQYALRVWVTMDYHRHMRHRRLGMSRLDYWQLHAKDHVQLPPNEEWLRQALMRREIRRVRGCQVQVNTYPYWHERLQNWDGCEVGIRWDPGDLTRVQIIPDAETEPFWAGRNPVKSVDSPADLAEHKRQRRAVKNEKHLQVEAAEAMASASPAESQNYLDLLREKRKRAPIPFPVGAEKVEPVSKEETEEKDAKLLRDLFPHRYAGSLNPDVFPDFLPSQSDGPGEGKEALTIWGQTIWVRKGESTAGSATPEQSDEPAEDEHELVILGQKIRVKKGESTAAARPPGEEA